MWNLSSEILKMNQMYISEIKDVSELRISGWALQMIENDWRKLMLT